MSVALSEVDFDHCPFCHDSFQRIWGCEGWREYMQDIYESYDFNKGGNYCYKIERKFVTCAKCHRDVKFGDLNKK